METQSEFLLGGEGRPPVPDARSLVSVSASNAPLSKAQQTFRRLVAKIEKLQGQFDRETARLTDCLNFYAAELHPLEQKILTARKELIRLLFPFLRDPRIRPGPQREALSDSLSSLLQSVIREQGDLVEEDLQKIFQAVEGLSVDQAKEDDIQTVSELIEEDLARMGIDVDLSGFKADMTPEELAARMKDLEQQFSEQAGTPPPRPRRQSKSQLAKEAREREMEELRTKNIGSLYKQLAKLLHPDLEQDPTLRAEKEAAMKKLTIAHRDGDLHALLKLEIEWISREQNDVNRLTEEKLVLYNQVLKEQAVELQGMIDSAHEHPRYLPLMRYADPFTGLRSFDPNRVRLEVSAEAKRCIGAVDLLRGPHALAEVRKLAKDMRKASRWGRLGDGFDLDPFGPF